MHIWNITLAPTELDGSAQFIPHRNYHVVGPGYVVVVESGKLVVDMVV